MMKRRRPQVNIRFFRIRRYYLLEITCSYTVLAKSYVFHGELTRKEFGKLLSNSSCSELLNHPRGCVHALEHGVRTYVIVKEQEHFGFVFYGKQDDCPELFAALSLHENKIDWMMNVQDITLTILQADHLLLLIENSPTFRSFRERFR